MAVLITGVTGLLGSFIGLGLLKYTSEALVLLYRDHYPQEKVKSLINNYLQTEGLVLDESLQSRLYFVKIPTHGPITDRKLIEKLVNLNVKEIIHAAGSVDYYNKEKLKLANINLTQELVKIGREININRFIFISTAYSKGHSNGIIQERLHEDSAQDPTLYTKTKREAEWLVAKSEIPYLIIRPSIVIGDSQDGHYFGKPYGIYQFTEVYKKIFCNSYLPEAHLVAPEIPLNLLHQDSFMEGFVWGYRYLAPGSVFNLVSSLDSLPSPKDIFNMWMQLCVRPKKVFYYSSPHEVPTLEIDQRLKVLLEISKVNTGIASSEWKFETTHLDSLIKLGCPFKKTTKESVNGCMSWVAKNSQEVQEFLKNNQINFPQQIKVVEYSKNQMRDYSIPVKGTS